MEKFTIAPAAEAEREWCARLMSESDPWVTLGRQYDDCLQRCLHPEYLLHVAHDDGQPCGFILTHPRGVAGSPYVASVAVAPAWRGHGIGTRLMEVAERHFGATSRHIFLCVSSFNERAQALYLRLGYQVVGVLQDYVIAGASETLMHKRLGR